MMLDRVRDSLTAWRKRAGETTPQDERIVLFDVTRGVVDGACYLVFEDDSEQPALVAKVARTVQGKAIFRAEFETLSTLDRIGMNQPQVTTPRPLDLREDDGVLVTLQSALSGTLIKNLPGRELFSADRADATIRQVLDWWEDFQTRYGAPRELVSPERYQHEVVNSIEKFRGRYVLDDAEQQFIERRFIEERRLEGVTLPWMARHGDFCTANMVLRPEGVGVFDWEFALERKLPLFDLFFFFASTRFPYSGRRGESGHLESFVELYWGESYLARKVRAALDLVCRRYEIPRECMADLFVIALIEVANMKFEAQLEGHGMPGEFGATDSPTDDDKLRLWKKFASPDKDAPFACIRDGVFQNLRHVVNHGTPAF